MNAIPTDVAMQHVRAEEYDREHVELLLAAAEDSAAQFMNRRFYADAETMAEAVLAGEAGDDPILINPSVKAACLLILGSLYGNREDVVVGTISSELPMGSRSLLTPYRVGWGV
ncbi:phage gp6-like head-tail connector protein [Pseudomonas capeferrum]|uniref:head-tail connector protein n=1 Tax=Pseudomonas capeferrum TaxID=1495066 RepID=UPI0015E3A10D|nr:head-tail connector protein [Pseudomonas capeferrum]MBA1200457.1 phage gp6-like head-tail connector protein [Pseudomonas capeferrum]